MDISTESSTLFRQNFTNTVSEIHESIAPPVLQFIIGVTGNIAALVILIRSSTEHKWKPFYRFVGGLIASDLSGIIIVCPLIISTYVSNFTFVFPTALCGFISFTLTFAFMTNAFTICAMSLDRFLAFIFPLTYRKLSNGFRINLTLLGIWISSAIINCLHVIGLGSFRSFYPGSWCFINFTSDDAKDKVFTCLFAVIGLLIIVSTITLNTTVILSMSWKFCKGERRSSKDKRNEVSIIIYIVAVVIFFVVCTTPLMIRMLMHVSTDDHRHDEKTDLLTARLSVANVIIDPRIYLVFKKTTFTSISRLSRSVSRRFMAKQVKGKGKASEVTNKQDLSGRIDETYI